MMASASSTSVALVRGVIRSTIAFGTGRRRPRTTGTTGARIVGSIVDREVDARGPHPGACLTIGELAFGLAERWPEPSATVSRRFPDLSFAYRDLDLADPYDAIRFHQVDVGIVHHVGPVDGVTFEPVPTAPRVAVVPARSSYADADPLTPADVEHAAWVPVAGAHPELTVSPQCCGS
jgi:hypothetical protein